MGNDWREAGVPAEMRPSFERFTRKVLCLWHIGCCGVCGTRQGKQRAVWALNMRVCRGCWLENIVSHRTLLKVFQRAPVSERDRLAQADARLPDRNTGSTCSSR